MRISDWSSDVCSSDLQAKANDTQDPAEVDRIIAEELETLLDSPMFTRSPVLSRLLQFLVEHRLRGRSSPKAYAIATEALGRSEDFDPAVDSYPRVMVGRLRSLLDRYYADKIGRASCRARVCQYV